MINLLLENRGSGMKDIVFLLVTIALAFIIHNLICYKKKKLIYVFSKKKYIILKPDYFTAQLIFGTLNSIFMILFNFYAYRSIENPSLYILFNMMIFWGMNFLLDFYSRRNKYIVINQEYY